MSVLSGSCVQGTAEGLFLCILSENCAYETEKEDAMKHFFRSMLALALVFGMLALCACSKKNDPIPNVRDDPQDRQEPQPGGDPGSDEPQGRKVEPLPSDLTLDGLTDAALAAVPDLASAKEQGGKTLLELTVYDTEHYDIVDIATLQPGDIVVSGGREFTVETLQQDEFGGVTINGGVGLDGLQLSTQENDNGYFSVGLDGEANYYEAGRLTLPLAKDFTFVDASDISQPEQTRSAAELLALAGSTDDPGFSPVSTTVMVENGQIRQILRIFLP